MLSNQQIQNNWPQIKSQVLSKWSKLSESEVERTHGSVNSLSSLVQNKYGNIPDFEKTYEKICESCIPSSRNISKSTVAPKAQRQADGIPDFENRPSTAPSAEAGMPEYNLESPADDTFHSGSPERRSNANFAKVNNEANFNREADDELSAYTADSRTSLDDEDSSEYTILNNDKLDTQFSAPDEFTPSQDPSPSREDITLGRNASSATKLSTAKAASNSSEASSDAKKRI